MIVVVQSEIANIGSVANALIRLKIPFEVSADINVITAAEKLILPGVGSFKEGMAKLNASGIANAIRHQALDKKTPILGICLGMQLLCKVGFEHGETEGLGLIDGQVVPLDFGGVKVERSIHMGWNDVSFDSDDMLYSGITAGACFYFVHGFHAMLNERIQVATTEYGRPLIASFRKNNIFGTQFHPEKSQNSGLKLLRNFCELC